MAVRAEPIYPVPWYRGRFVSWLVTTDHKRIGVLYIWTSLFFFLVGGVMALMIRTELLTPETADFVSRQTFNQLFTMHGLTMVFLVIVPILAGFGNYLVPLMIGARDMVFPRLNAFSYWTFLLGGTCSTARGSRPAAPRTPAGTCTRPTRPAPGRPST